MTDPIWFAHPTGYSPPDVRWIEHGVAGWPDPPPDPNATDLESLRYSAALIKARGGPDIRIGQINHYTLYDYAIYTSHGEFRAAGCCGTYLETNAFLNGVEVGASASVMT